MRTRLQRNAMPLPALVCKRCLAPVLLIALCAFISACSSPKATQKSPELPPRHWLGETPGLPFRSDKDRELHTSVPLTLYSPEKRYNFEDCVYLAIQQSPLLVKSSIKLEMSQLKEKDAKWQYLPELHMLLTSAVNLTKYNEGNPNNYGDYGRTVLRARFYATVPDPFTTYFTNKAQQVMTNIAVLAHRKAIGMAIWEIADTYLQMHAQKRIRDEQAKLPDIAKESTTYWKALDSSVGGQAIDMDKALQNEKQIALQQDKTRHVETMVRMRLKTLIGLSSDQPLETEHQDNAAIFQDFDGRKLYWEDRWTISEEYLSEKMGIVLQDYNIMLAWAKYMPTISLDLNTYPPAGQAQPYGGREDFFLHFGLDFTLLDWGRRYRGVQTARMNKAIAFQSLAEKRTKYENAWSQCRQEYAMAVTDRELARGDLRSAELEQQKSEIQYAGGTLPLPMLTKHKEAVILARVSLIKAELAVQQAELKWMHMAGILEERFMDVPNQSLPHQIAY
ncbi:MAG: TolC family protein [Desulfovibrionaceae bacterium]|nr:TolC family protein [Desulfovibrionaceae bacterium]